ncbi:MAG: hypothetical protein NE328_17800 [Lentisphaeraceae bacterium]|nr:hypothetical protein [Lentisphaeraceae bacterium]
MKSSIIAVWALSTGIAFYAGYSTRSTNTENSQKEFSESAKKNSDLKESVSRETSDSTSGKQRRINTTASNRPPVNVVLADLKALLGETGMMSMDMASLAESYNLVKNLNEEELLEALNQMQGNLNNPSTMMPLMLILGQYANVNPLNAMAFYENNITSPQTKMVALSGILSSWSKNDPEGAYEWYQDKGSKDSSGGMMGGSSFSLVYIFQGLAKKDLNATIDKLKSLDNSGFQAQMAASGIASSLRTKEDFVGFIEKTKDLDNVQIRNSVLQNWLLRNPTETVEWVDSMEDKDEKKKYKDQVLSGWMMSNPKEAADWYIAKAEGKDKQASADKVIQRWSFSNPKAAMEWLETQDGLDSQKSIKTLFESASFSNPGFVTENLDQLTDDKDKKTVSQKIYQSLLRQNKKKAEEFLEESPYKEDLLKGPKWLNTTEVAIPIE